MKLNQPNRSRGKAKHDKPVLHGNVANFPLEHCANLPCTQAFCPLEHDDDGVSDANSAFSFCASWPFCSVNDARLRDV